MTEPKKFLAKAKRRPTDTISRSLIPEVYAAHLRAVEITDDLDFASAHQIMAKRRPTNTVSEPFNPFIATHMTSLAHLVKTEQLSTVPKLSGQLVRDDVSAPRSLIRDERKELDDYTDF